MGSGYNIFTYNWILVQLRPHYRYLQRERRFQENDY